MIWKNFAVIAAIMLLGFVPSQIGMWIIEHEGWVGKALGHHGADLDCGEFQIPHRGRRRVALDLARQHLAPLV